MKLFLDANTLAKQTSRDKILNNFCFVVKYVTNCTSIIKDEDRYSGLRFPLNWVIVIVSVYFQILLPNCG